MEMAKSHNLCPLAAENVRDRPVPFARKSFIALHQFCPQWGQYEDCICINGIADSMPYGRGRFCPKLKLEFEPFPECG
jgi:hypothetical protein